MTRRRLGMLMVALAPVMIASAAALILGLTRPNLALESVTPLPTAIVIAGVVVSLVFFGLVLSRSAVRSAAEKGVLEGQRAQRHSHRTFLARLDHELKNPITAIRAAVAASESSSSDTQIRSIESQTSRLTRLVADLRKLAELEHEPLEREEVNLENVASDAIEAVREELAATPAAGPREFSLDFPRVPWPLTTIQGDLDLLFLAIYNLISNAAKFSPDGAAIVVRATETTTSVTLEIADTGMGIPSDDLPTIWEELARGSNARAIVGSGLGLSLVRTVVERHDGQVELRSALRQGTSVRITLPKVDK